MDFESWIKKSKEVREYEINDTRDMIRGEIDDPLRIIDRKAEIKNMLDYLDSTTFYTDPASSNKHCGYPGGLAEHSYNVYRWLYKLCHWNHMPCYSNDTIFICSIFHDVCKIGCYHKTKKWRKDNAGHLESYPSYQWKDDYPLGYGEKSVAIINKFINLTEEESLAIRWHMGRFDMAANSHGGLQLLGMAQHKSPLVTALHLADMMATWFDETEYEE